MNPAGETGSDSSTPQQQTPEIGEQTISGPNQASIGANTYPGWFYLEQFRSQGALEDLNKAMKCFTHAVSLTPDDDENLATWLTSRGIAFSERFKRLGALTDLEQSITCIARALRLTPDGHPSVPGRLTSLGASYGDRHQRLGELADIKNAIEHFSRALALTPDGHPKLPHRYASLGVAYTELYRRLGELEDLEKSIENKSRALALTPVGHPDMAFRHADIGVSYTDRYRRLGELSDLEKAIESDTHALALTPGGHPSMSSRYSDLGVSYSDRYQRLGELADLDNAIGYHSRALESIPDGHPDISHRHAGLGMAYTERYKRLGELADLEKATESHFRAVALTPNDHPDMPSQCANLGVSYGHRYRRLGELTDLEKVIECYSRALASTPEGHTDMPGRYSGLGAAYNDRYQRLGELTDLEKSIESKAHAIALTPDDHPEMSCRYADIGSAYTDRYRRLGELADLEKSIEKRSRALTMTPVGHPHIPRRHTGLGVAYSDRYRRLGNLTDLEKAIECHSCAIALTPDGHPDLPRRHFNHGVDMLQHYRHTSQPSQLYNSLRSFHAATQVLAGVPRDKLQFALQWASLACEYTGLNPIQAYQTAIDLLPQTIWLGATANQRYQDLSMRELDNLAVNACRAAIQSSDYSLALEWLEHARCIVWNQSLMLRSPLDRLRLSHPDIAYRLKIVANELHVYSFETRTDQSTLYDLSTQEQVGQQRRRLATEYYSLLAEIRQVPGFESFLKSIKAKELMRGVQSGPVVVVNCHKDQCDALIILPGYDGVKHVPLPSFTEKQAQQARSELQLSLKHKRLRQRGVKVWGQSDPVDNIGSVLRILWSGIVKPVLDYLGYTNHVSSDRLPHITWCPTGPLSFLPLHAAGDYDQPQARAFDYAVSSYIPTLSALIASTPSSLNRNCRVLAVGQATTPGQNPLPGISKELAYVKAHTHTNADYSQLIDDQATTTSVLDAMEHHDWVHLACHAHQNVNDPTKSGFYLHDGTLDLVSINRRSFKNKGLAFLSACQTATGDEKLPDEAIHLASGMLMAGYPSVIATMWSVVDDDAPFVADKVYGQLMKDGKIGNGEAGRALHDAVAGLRGCGEKWKRRILRDGYRIFI
ncbi:Genome polyprotein [Rhizoctonia solani]|uniref:Genome polyprotein n=1 Tax=Rhizoctonia solani TaxID=456999 RepID=A0A0K6FXR5_9AGAM|nr:Genome polyprotein [Rhizoctonia solani]